MAPAIILQFGGSCVFFVRITGSCTCSKGSAVEAGCLAGEVALAFSVCPAKVGFLRLARMWSAAGRFRQSLMAPVKRPVFSRLLKRSR